MAIEEMAAEIRGLPEPLAQQVSDFIAFLRVRHDRDLWQSWLLFSEEVSLTEAGFADYLSALQDYEERLARGEIQW